MIKANELRIGNVLNKGGVYVAIDARSIFDIWEQSDKYSPIPLTPQLLKKCGFIETENQYSQSGFLYTLRYGQKDRRFSWFNTIVFSSEGKGVTIVDIQHVEFHYLHHLQNIYFALTNQELNPLANADGK